MKSHLKIQTDYRKIIHHWQNQKEGHCHLLPVTNSIGTKDFLEQFENMYQTCLKWASHSNIFPFLGNHFNIIIENVLQNRQKISTVVLLKVLEELLNT